MVWAVSLSTMNLITHGLTPKEQVRGIRSLTEVGNPCGPRVQSVLYLRVSLLEASPKAISGRTSYLRVRLAFHPYPPLIPALFNVRGCGPPAGFTLPSPWRWVAHPVSGRRLRTIRPLQTRFRYGSGLSSLNLARKRHSPVHSTKGTPSHI